LTKKRESVHANLGGGEAEDRTVRRDINKIGSVTEEQRGC